MNILDRIRNNEDKRILVTGDGPEVKIIAKIIEKEFGYSYIQESDVDYKDDNFLKKMYKNYLSFIIESRAVLPYINKLPGIVCLVKSKSPVVSEACNENFIPQAESNLILEVDPSTFEEHNQRKKTIYRNECTVNLIDLNGHNDYYTYQTKEECNPLVIWPHNEENTNSLELLKFKIWAEKQNRTVTSVGVINQVPLFSQFSDKIIVRDKKDTLKASYFCAHSNYSIPTHLPPEEQGERIDIGVPSISGHDFKYYPPFQKMINSAISDEEVIEKYKNPEIWILRRTYELFKTLNLPRNLVIVEMKPRCEGFEMMEIIGKNKHLFKYQVEGCHWDFQRILLKSTGHQDYMGVQVLASLLLNWVYVCWGGSSNLMSLLPIKVAQLSDTHTNPHAELVKKLGQARWGKYYPLVGDMAKNINKFASHVNDFVDNNQIEAKINE